MGAYRFPFSGPAKAWQMSPRPLALAMTYPSPPLGALFERVLRSLGCVISQI